MKQASGSVYIAGSKTADDWRAFKATLATAADSDTWWREAFDTYFQQRLALRYLDPIKVLQDHGTYQGDGFSIVAIECTLIEFLESTLQGRSYRFFRRGDPPLGPHEYSNSGELFVAFLSTRAPFATDFSAQLARDFYEGVRCGLLHEARTRAAGKSGRRAQERRPPRPPRKIVYRDRLQAALLEFIEWYREELPADAALQAAFIRKFDSLIN